jgi:hypothetical protein
VCGVWGFVLVGLYIHKVEIYVGTKPQNVCGRDEQKKTEPAVAVEQLPAAELLESLNSDSHD